MFCYLGVTLADTHGAAFLRLLNPQSVETMLVAEGTLKAIAPKVIDTSCIIDGRIEEQAGLSMVLRDFAQACEKAAASFRKGWPVRACRSAIER